MGITQKIWKVRRDGVRQRYRVAEPAYESGVYRTLARAFSDAHNRGKVERYNPIARLSHAERMFPELARRRAYAAILSLIEQLGAQGARAVPALRWIYEQSTHHIADDEKRKMVKSSAREAIAGIGGADADQFHADIIYGRFLDYWHINSEEKKRACVYFGKHHSDVGVEALSHILHSADYSIAKTALESITEHDDPRLTAAIAAAIDKPPSESLFYDIIARLDRLNMRDLAPHVLEALKDVEPYARSRIVSHIRGIRDPETVAVLVQHGALQHPNYTVREATCYAIGNVRYREAIPMLQQLHATETSERVRKAAQYALENMDALPKRASSKRASPKRR